MLATWWNLRKAKSKNLRTRLLAIKKLGRVGNARAARTLTMLLDSQIADVRQAAEEALQQMGSLAVESLAARLDDHSNLIRRNAIYLLGQIGDRKAVKPLIATARDPDEQAQMKVAEALGKLGDPRALEPLIEMLGNESPWIRFRAAEALGKIGDRRSADRLRKALGDEYAFVRQSVIEALGLIGDAAAIRCLVDQLRDDSPAIRHIAGQALERICWQPGDTTEAAYFAVALHRWDDAKALGTVAVEPLAALLADRDTVVCAISTLGEIGGDRVVELLIGVLNGKTDVRKIAASELGTLGNPKAIDALLAALNDENELMRETILRALKNFRDPRIIPPVVTKLRDPDIGVREAAASVLKVIGWTPQNGNERAWLAIAVGDWKEVAACGASAVDPLLTVLAAKYPSTIFLTIRELYVRAKGLSAMVLGQLAERRAVEPLLTILNDADARVRETAAWALMRIGDPKAVQGLVTRLGDPIASVRARAAYALGVLADLSAVEPLARLLPFEQAPTGTVIAWALERLTKVTCTTQEQKIQRDVALGALRGYARSQQVGTSSPAIDPADFAAEQLGESIFELGETLTEMFLDID